MIAIIAICPVSRYQTKICIVRTDILPCDAMLHLLKYSKCVHHVMISKSCFTALYVDILQYDELLQLPSFKLVIFENECQALTSSSERYIMMGIMMGVLISLNDFNLSICLLNSKVLNSRMTYLKYGI